MTLRAAVLTSALPSLALIAGGAAAELESLQERAAAPLATALGLKLCSPLAALQPDPALEALARAASALAPLPVDPGRPLEDGRHWASALGAWRQPVVLLLSARQVEGGLPAALHALITVWQVPCLGLVQWGGTWDPQARRRDGLPWLGRLGAAEAADPPKGEQNGAKVGEEGDEEEQALALRRAVTARWAALRSSLEEAPLA